MKKSVWGAAIEVGFVVFLFYSNLLMGEFERSGMGAEKGTGLGNRRCVYICQLCNCHDRRAGRLLRL